MSVGFKLPFTLKMRGKITPPPDIPAVWIKSKNCFAYRVGHCMFQIDVRADSKPVYCEQPIFAYDKNLKTDRCHKHADATELFTRTKG